MGAAREHRFDAEILPVEVNGHDGAVLLCRGAPRGFPGAGRVSEWMMTSCPREPALAALSRRFISLTDLPVPRRTTSYRGADAWHGGCFQLWRPTTVTARRVPMRTVASLFRPRRRRDDHRAAAASATVVLSAALMLAPTSSFAERFDFDSAPIHTSLPISLTVGTVTAHFTASGSGFSIQPANTMGFTPSGFGGLCIYPNSVFAADLTITFDQVLSDITMMYAPQELACDSSAIMRITAWKDAILVGSNLTTAPVPGTWPTGTLAFSSSFGFNRVVVHYERAPGGGGDWGPIFMADNMDVTIGTLSAPMARAGAPGLSVEPNPASSIARIRVELTRSGPFSVSILDTAGRRIRTLAADRSSGPVTMLLEWDGCDDSGFPVGNGIYFCRVQAATGTEVTAIAFRR